MREFRATDARQRGPSLIKTLYFRYFWRLFWQESVSSGFLRLWNFRETFKIYEKMTTEDLKLIDIAEHRWIRRLPQAIARPVEQTLALDVFNDCYARYCRKLSAFGNDSALSFDTALNVLGATCDVSSADMNKIPVKGPLVVVSNHPFGGLEGVALGSLLLRVRPDVKTHGQLPSSTNRGHTGVYSPCESFRDSKIREGQHQGVEGILEASQRRRGARCLSGGRGVQFSPEKRSGGRPSLERPYRKADSKIGRIRPAGIFSGTKQLVFSGPGHGSSSRTHRLPAP